MSKLFIFMTLLSLGACSNKQIYDAVQHNQQLECAKLPQVRYEECMREVDVPYDEYEREREAVLKGSAQ